MKTSKYILTLALALSCACGTVFAIEQSYYSTIDGTNNTALRDALQQITQAGPVGISYDGLWDAYKTTDVYPADSVGKAGNIWDMYSDCTFKPGTDQCGNYSNVCDCYNREHSLPKSWFDDKKPAYNDLGHIVPTDGKVNGMRSNWPFAELAAGAKTWGTGKLGNAKSITVHNTLKGTITTTYEGTSFEPDDQYKGDFARMYMYMAVRYGKGNVNGITLNHENGVYMFNADDENYGLTDFSVALLMKWHRQDPVSRKEIDRNNGMEDKQGNRNPFIDYPCLAEYLWGEKAGETIVLAELIPTYEGAWQNGDGCPCGATPRITMPKSDIYIGDTKVGTPIYKSITVQGVNLEDGISFSLGGANASLFSLSVNTMTQEQALEGGTLTITYDPTEEGEHKATLVISGGGLSKTVELELSAECCEPYEVELVRNGVSYFESVCGVFALPKEVPGVGDGWEFSGWVTEPIEDGATEEPTYVTSVGKAGKLYAVYAKTEGGSGTALYERLTTEPEDWSGNYLIVYEETSSKGIVLDGSLAKIDVASNTKTFDITDDAIACNAETEAISFTIAPMADTDGKYCIKAKSGKYIGSTNTSKNDLQESENPIANSLSLSSNVAIIKGAVNYMNYSTVADQKRFRYYKSGTCGSGQGNGDYKPIHLYKSSFAGVTTYHTNPVANYMISYADADGIAQGGMYSALPPIATAGEQIVLNVDEGAGYDFTGWTVYKTDDPTVIIEIEGNSFEMPAYNVTVKANFEAACTGKLATPAVMAIPGDQQITLAWKEVADAENYEVVVSAGEGFTTECGNTTIGEITIQDGIAMCLITGLVNGLEYTATVRALSTTVCNSDAGLAEAVPTEAEPEKFDLIFNVNFLNIPANDIPYGTPMDVVLEGATSWLEQFGVTQNDKGQYIYVTTHYIYTFYGWDPELPDFVTESATYTALYTEEPRGVPSDIEQLEHTGAVKVLENGVMYIYREGKKYSAQGALIK